METLISVMPCMGKLGTGNSKAQRISSPAGAELLALKEFAFWTFLVEQWLSLCSQCRRPRFGP